MQVTKGPLTLVGGLLGWMGTKEAGLMSKGLRVPVLVDRGAYDQFKAYSDLTGVPMARLVRDAMHEYAEVTLAARTEALMSKTATCTVVDDIDLAEVIDINTFAHAAKA